MTKEIYQIKIALRGFKPTIWRQLLIPSDLLLSDFHKIIQTTMGWDNSHLHQFIKNQVYYSVKHVDDSVWNKEKNIDYKKKKIQISELLKAEKEKLTYEYDFGDGWEHDIILEKILPVDEKIKYPICLAGEMSCPPEDCGGTWGYAHMLEVLKQPDHDEYENYIEWFEDGEFDPEYFDKDEVNKLLGKKDYGCFE